jgi:ATP-binding cassette, subfamily C, bacterial CydD
VPRLSIYFAMTPASKTSNRRTIRWLLQQVRAARSWLALAVGLGTGSGLLLILQARLLSRIVQDVFIEDVPPDSITAVFLVLAGVFLARALLAWAREMSAFQAGAAVRNKVRMDLVLQIMQSGPSYTSRQRTGALASTVMEQVEGLHDFFAFYLPQLALAVFVPVAILIAVFPISWAAGGLLLVTAPLIPIFMVLVGMGAENISQRHFQALARLSAHFLDVLQGLTTLKLFGRSRDEAQAVARVSADYRRKTMAVLRIAFLSSAVLEFFSTIAIALVAVYLGTSFLGYVHFGLYGNTLTLADGLFILLLAPEYFLPLRDLGSHYHARAQAIGAAEEILTILSDSRPGPDGKLALNAKSPPRIRFDDVHVAFENGKRPALNGLGFQLDPGEHVVLVGPSGAGKSTVLNVLLGFLRPDRGTVMINDVSLADLSLESWRSQVAWIGQQPVLFYGSVRENILLGRAKATPVEVERAAHHARVLDFTRDLPAGLDTLVGEQGLGLSRGQAQRVALARAFLRDAPLLLLDEPTSGLDTENERFLLDAVQRLASGKTVVMITHHLEAIRSADRIMVLADGRIVEQGSYAGLIAAGGVFQRMATSSPWR